LRSNITSSSSSIVRRSKTQKSNIEFTSSLRALFAAAQSQASADQDQDRTNPSSLPYTAWTSQQASTLFIPTLDFSQSGLAEDRAKYEITVKLFFLPNKPASDRCAQSREAIEYVLKELHVSNIDLLIISYPGIAYDADDEASSAEEQNNTSSESRLEADAAAESIDAMISTWKCLEQFHDEGVIKRLGVSEFGIDRLKRFLGKARIRPEVDQINVKDCCVVPRPLVKYAKEEEIQLLTHADCTNILSTEEVGNLLGQDEGSAGILGAGGIEGEVVPQWVIKYTAVVKDRGVIENKGYFGAVAVS
jgi:glutamate--cysteine ligase regulatory subunit